MLRREAIKIIKANYRAKVTDRVTAITFILKDGYDIKMVDEALIYKYKNKVRHLRKMERLLKKGQLQKTLQKKGVSDWMNRKEI